MTNTRFIAAQGKVIQYYREIVIVIIVFPSQTAFPRISTALCA